MALPDFIIVGAQKAGTCTLFHGLRQHPDIHMAEWHEHPWEVRYFTRHFNKGRAWYEGLFVEGKLNGEKSPSYLFEMYCHERIKDLVPDAKLIVILRNPVDRTYSDWADAYLKGYGGGKLRGVPFSQAIRDHQSWIIRGSMYADHLESIWKFFPRERVHIEISERFWANMGAGFRRIYKFLGVPDNRRARYGHCNPGVNVEPLTPQQLGYLRQAFEAPNRHLRKLLDDGIEEWSC